MSHTRPWEAPAQVSRRALNDRLARAEQLLADDAGAPERAWYRHVYHGWNIYSLYDGQPFPGLAAALRTSDTARATAEVRRIETALARMARALDEARTLIGSDNAPDRS